MLPGRKMRRGWAEKEDKMTEIDAKAIWPGWETVKILGRGSFGAVYEIRREVLGETEKARELAVEFFNELLVSSRFYLEYYDYAQSEFELCGQYVYYLQDIADTFGDKDLAERIGTHFEALMDYLTGEPKTVNEDPLDLGNIEEGDTISVG